MILFILSSTADHNLNTDLFSSVDGYNMSKSEGRKWLTWILSGLQYIVELKSGFILGML